MVTVFPLLVFNRSKLNHQMLVLILWEVFLSTGVSLPFSFDRMMMMAANYWKRYLRWQFLISVGCWLICPALSSGRRCGSGYEANFYIFTIYYFPRDFAFLIPNSRYFPASSCESSGWAVRHPWLATHAILATSKQRGNRKPETHRLALCTGL